MKMDKIFWKANTPNLLDINKNEMK